MEPRRLERSAFNRPTLRVARELLGTFIVRDDGGRRVSAMISEVEAYKGPRDRASHAYGGRRTSRVEALYGEGGTVYVYLVYGLHWLLNFSTGGAGKPEGVLVRGLVLDPTGERRAIDGPGRVGRFLSIDARLYGVDATRSHALWLEDRGLCVPARSLARGARIGVDYAGEYWAARPWRFWIDGDVRATSARGERARTGT